MSIPLYAGEQTVIVRYDPTLVDTAAVGSIENGIPVLTLGPASHDHSELIVTTLIAYAATHGELQVSEGDARS
jgi:hypothetical protein